MGDLDFDIISLNAKGLCNFTKRRKVFNDMQKISRGGIIFLQETSNAKQCWLADDASGAGFIKDVLKWWQSLEKMGPMFGYHPNAIRCWLIVKPNKYVEAIEAFQNTGINVTTEGRRHLGAALGSRDFLEGFVNDTVNELKVYDNHFRNGGH